MKIDFVIPVRDRENERVQRCINSLKSKLTGNIIIVDYGSKKPVKVKGCKIIRVKNKKTKIWNKSHALNIGIKRCTNEFIATVDCDICLGKKFLSKCRRYLKKDSFIYSRFVRRIIGEVLDWNVSEKKIESISIDWLGKNQGSAHLAVGGIQIFPKWWIEEIHGYDENLIYWGGIDNDIHERAMRTGLIIVDLNELIFHQEHEKIKEKNLDNEDEIKYAIFERNKRRLYLIYKWQNNINIGNKIWGEIDNPQCNEINLHYTNKIPEIEEKYDTKE